MNAIGIDVGGGSVKGAVVDGKGRIVASVYRKNSVAYEPEKIIGLIAECIGELIPGAADSEIPIGIGVPGSVDDVRGTVPFADNIGFVNVDVRSALRSLTGRTVRLINDADAAALGEARYGAAAGADSAVIITLGTGVGGGIISGGRLITGLNGIAGEIGHMVIKKDGEPCKCGRRGCFEAYASATALVRMAKRAMEAAPDSLLLELAERDGGITGRAVFEAADMNDTAALAVTDEYLGYLAAGTANIINILSPEVIAFSGGIANRGEKLLAPLREAVLRETYGSAQYREHTRIAVCALGYDAGMIGAAEYARSR